MYSSNTDASSNSNEVKPAQTLAEAIQEVVSEVTRDINDRTGMIRQGSALDLPSQDEEGNPLPGTVRFISLKLVISSCAIF